MKRKLLMSAALLTVLTFIAVSAYSAMGRGFGPGYRQGTNAAPALTQDQKDKIFKIQNTLKSDITPLQTDLRQARYDLQKVLTAATLDEKQAQALQDKISGLRDKIEDKTFKARLDILKVLTPEQRQNWGGYMGGKGFGMMGDFGGGRMMYNIQQGPRI
jgi:Spy/CpxP family protein refolding chaperone